MEHSTYSRAIAGASALIAVGSLTVSVLFVVQDSQDDRKQREFNEQIVSARTEARRVTCEKDKKFAEAHNKLVTALATAGGTRPITREIQPKVDEQLVEVPDCSESGIADFYDGRS